VPNRAKATAAAAPKPLEAPVIKTQLPFQEELMWALCRRAMSRGNSKCVTKVFGLPKCTVWLCWPSPGRGFERLELSA